MVTTTGAFAAVDYVVNVWILTTGTSVTYSLGKGPASLDAVRAVVKKVAALDPEQTAHVIADDKTSMASLFSLSKSIHDGGLTNIVVSVFFSASPSTPSNGGKQVDGMSLDIHLIHDFDIQETKGVQPTNAPYSDPAVRSQKR